MQRRKSASESPVGFLPGRPSRTDGSDFTYRMVVESRYKKVAEGKKQLLIVQVLIQLTGALFITLTKLLHLSDGRIRLEIQSSNLFESLYGCIFDRVHSLRETSISVQVAKLVSQSREHTSKDKFIIKHIRQFQVIHDLSHPSNWKGEGIELFGIIRVLSWL